MIELWHCERSRSFRALWALEEMGLPYKLHLMTFPPRVHHKDYLALNPLGTIPLLIDGDQRMTESAAIPQYLATRYGPSPLAVAPDEPDYAAYLNWLHHGEATLTFPQTIWLRYVLFDPDQTHAQVGEDYRTWFLKRLRMLDAALSDGRDFLVAGRFTMADIVVSYAIQLAAVLKARDEIAPHIIAWSDRLTQRPAWQRARAASVAGG